MNNNHKLVKDAFSKISTSKEFEKKLINMTVNNKKPKYMLHKYAIVTLVCLCASLICFGAIKSIKFNNENLDNKIIKENTDKDIYMIIKDNEQFSWAYDITDSKQVVEHADFVVKVTILDIENGTYMYSPSNSNPTTPIKVKTIQIMKGNENENISQILKWGGIVTIEEVIQNKPSTSTSKMGLDKLSDEERKSKYIKYEEVGNYDFQIGKTYIVALKNNIDGNFYIGANGYSIFEDSDEDDIYTNVITGEEFEI